MDMTAHEEADFPFLNSLTKFLAAQIALVFFRETNTVAVVRDRMRQQQVQLLRNAGVFPGKFFIGDQRKGFIPERRRHPWCAINLQPFEFHPAIAEIDQLLSGRWGKVL